MIFKTRNIDRAVDQLHDFGYKNLIVSGCSFTYNNSDEHVCAWPYYLRDIGGFETVLDSSLPGAGNAHIANSLKWAIEIDQPAPEDSLVIVMWSGNNRDDCIIPADSLNSYAFKFLYSKHVASGITGGNHDGAGSNINDFQQPTKSKESRAIENYLHIVSTYHYLQSKNYRFVFLNYCERDLVTLANDFEIFPYLPVSARKKLKSIVTDTVDVYKWAAGHNDLYTDQFHANTESHLTWTRQILLPTLKQLNIDQNRSL